MKVDPGTFQRPLEYSSACEEATLRLGAFLSRFVFPGLLVLLFGDLGAGKTVLVRGFVEGLSGGGVRSPSFTLVNEYDAVIGVTHADLFRLPTGEHDDLGLEEALEEGRVVFVEWPENWEIPPHEESWVCRLENRDPGNPDSRLVTIRGIGLRAQAALDRARSCINEELR